MDNAIATAFSVDRKLFVKALEQIGRIIPTRSGKQILQCVRITAESRAGGPEADSGAVRQVS
jgi:hypothetical protein